MPRKSSPFHSAQNRGFQSARRNRDLLEELWQKQREVGGTPCQADPYAWDAPARLTARADQLANESVRLCLGCPAFDECDRLVENDEDNLLVGVIAGRKLGFPKPAGRPANGTK